MALTDAQWEWIARLMPTPRGNCTLPARQALNGWLFIAREGYGGGAAGPRRSGQHDHEGPPIRGGGSEAQEGQAICRSRGGLTTKLHVIVADDRLPLSMALSPGHAGDGPWGRTLIERHGRQAGRPQLVADRADDGRATRRCAAEHGWELVAPPHPNRHAASQRPLDRAAYRARNLVERFFCRLKRFRGIHVRYHKLDAVSLGIIHLACTHIMTKQRQHDL